MYTPPVLSLNWKEIHRPRYKTFLISEQRCDELSNQAFLIAVDLPNISNNEEILIDQTLKLAKTELEALFLMLTVGAIISKL